MKVQAAPIMTLRQLKRHMKTLDLPEPGGLTVGALEAMRVREVRDDINAKKLAYYYRKKEARDIERAAQGLPPLKLGRRPSEGSVPRKRPGLRNGGGYHYTVAYFESAAYKSSEAEPRTVKTFEGVTREVASYFGISPDDIMNGHTKRLFMRARDCVVHRAVHELGIHPRAVSYMFGEQGTWWTTACLNRVKEHLGR